MEVRDGSVFGVGWKGEEIFFGMGRMEEEILGVGGWLEGWGVHTCPRMIHGGVFSCAAFALSSRTRPFLR